MTRRQVLAHLAVARSAFPQDRALSLEDMLNVFDFDQACRRRVAREAYDFVSGGAEDEFTLRRNREAFGKITFRPRMLVDVTRMDLSIELFNTKSEMPIFIAPTGTHGRMHAEGEPATARGAGQAKTIMGVSSTSSFPLAEIAKAATGPLWFQLYAGPDKEGTREKVLRAEDAGCKAILFTVDAPYYPHRERDLYNRLVRPEVQRELSARRRARPDEESTERYGLPQRFTATLTWPFLHEVAGWTKLPVLVKGILTAADAKLAVEHGAKGVVVSNHGGRYLDGAPATIEVLPEIVAAVGGRVPVLMDGGVRRGTDVLKALALGARAVFVGRPPLWGLGAHGTPGVARVMRLLQTELALAMGLAGVPNLAAIRRELVVVDK
jgi:isopentenyl diphosphate isomerase/L-lactate dehydrogenase-like FMN-dependent dehydrogenase